MDDLTPPPILYHYCSTDSFYKIITSRSVWLSAMSLSNDSAEGKLVSRAIRKFARRDFLDPKKVQCVLDEFEVYEAMFEGLAFCLSKESDLLSQWRGYAADGSGVSIGFSSSYLKALSESSRVAADRYFHICDVIYEDSQHQQRIARKYHELKQGIHNGVFDPPENIIYSAMQGDSHQAIMQRDAEHAIRRNAGRNLLRNLCYDLYQLKAYGYREEAEWRLLRHASVSDEFVKFRPSGNKLIPYMQIDLIDIPGHNMIETVLLGPKHATPMRAVEAVLKKAGYGDVPVIASDLTYR